MSDPSDTAPESSPTEQATAPGAPLTFPQEQLDRYAALAMNAMQLRNYVDLHRARLPVDLVRRWDAWYRGLGEVFQRAQADQIALRHLLTQLPTYRGELTRYRDAFAAHGGPRLDAPSSSSRDERGALSPWLIGGGGLALGLVTGFFVAGSRG